MRIVNENRMLLDDTTGFKGYITRCGSSMPNQLKRSCAISSLYNPIYNSMRIYIGREMDIPHFISLLFNSLQLSPVE